MSFPIEPTLAYFKVKIYFDYDRKENTPVTRHRFATCLFDYDRNEDTLDTRLPHTRDIKKKNKKPANDF